MSYSFDRYLSARNTLDDFSNPYLKAVLQNFAHKDWNELAPKLEIFSGKVSGKWRKLTEEIARPENHPKIRHFDAYNHRIDRIIRPYEMKILEDEVFKEGVFSEQQAPYEGIIKRYLLHGNGEAGLTCPLACTDGMIALIEHFIDVVPEEVASIYHHAKSGIDGSFAIGAQFMSEIQGGSNIPANVLKATKDGDSYRLYGNKFFCSAVHADYSVVTARIENTDDIGVFIVPSWLKGNKEKEIRNDYVINRLKWKIGTTELPSAEINYEGSVAHLIGPENRGVALAVSIVLTRSRLDIGFASAAFLMRAAREAKLYGRFREVFDRKIDEFPMAKAQLLDLEEAAKRTTGTAFEIYDRFHNTDLNAPTLEAFAVRELILLQKIYASKEAAQQLRTAISIFGGHGAIEDFSSIPRLFRDSLVNELWEGPRNVLLSQIYRDLIKALKHYSVHDILQEMLKGCERELISIYSKQVQDILNESLLELPTAQNMKAARQWEIVWEAIFIDYQQSVIEKYDGINILQDDAIASVSMQTI